MQRRNREISIFSLSAIDLFCSGMGAVMVVMVLLMPYYRKSAPPSPVQPLKPLSLQPVPKPEPISEPEPVPQPPKGATIRVEDIDLVFVIDATMSMEDEINSVKNGLVSMVSVLRRLSDDTRFGFAAFIDRDVPWSSPLLSVNRGRRGDANLQRLQRMIYQVELVGNEDWPEHVYGGLQKAVDLPWGDDDGDRRQMIVVIGDAPTHPEHEGASFKLVRRWSVGNAKRSVSTVFTGVPDSEEAAISIPYFKELAKAGDGQYLEDQGDLMGSILDLLIVR